MTYKKMSKSLTERFYRNYKAATAMELADVYAKPSAAKERAYSACLDMYFNDGAGYGFRIIGANTFSFSVGWLTIVDGKLCIRVETAENSYIGDVTNMF